MTVMQNGGCERYQSCRNARRNRDILRFWSIIYIILLEVVLKIKYTIYSATILYFGGEKIA